MITSFIALLSYSDGSAAIQAFGPYDTESAAEAARDELKALPAIQSGRWDILPCTQTHPRLVGPGAPGRARS